MAANSITGLNQVFPIYNPDETPFNDMVLHKASVNSVVMSLGDKITGEAYYRNNSLNLTMLEYIVYNGVKYTLVNPPTIIREGLTKDNSELKGMTKYSFEFYHPMYQLGNIPFCDVAVSTDQTRYLSENKTFSWIGKPQDFIDKLNKNLQGTQWIVEKSTAFPAEKEDELSDVLTFDKNMISDALKTFHDTWDVPYVVDVVSSSESSYASGKRFKVVIGLPVTEIYASESDRQLGTPFVFRMGQGVGLKNNSKNPRNNKIITRLAGYGSEKNIPYGYPQIVWNGAEDDPRLRYPLYDGIVGGRYVKLIQHPFTRNHLMPSVYSDAVNKKVNPNATGYNPNIELKDYYDAVGGDYPNQINPLAPSYEIHEFEDIKPEMDDGTSNVEILGAIPLNADLTPASEWVDDIDGDGNFVQSFFQITLPQLAFDLYACAAITQEMQINMRSGDCIGCTFPIQVDWDDYKLNFYDENGDFAPDGSQRDLSKYPKSNLGSINVIVQKENSTFGTIMPNIYQQPQSGDEFVILGISLPLEYITSAEQRLDEAMQSFLLENNVYYYDYPLKFDEHFLTTHTYILSQIKPNAILRFQYAGQVLGLYVKQLTIKYGTAVLPEYDITLTDNVDVVLNQIGQVAEDVEKLSSIISILRQSYNRNVWVELAKKLSKVSDDTAQGFIRFIQGLQVGNQFVTGLLGEGGVFRKEADGTTYLEADKMYIRIKAYFDNVEIRDYKHSAGNRIASPAGAKCCRVEYIDSNGNVTTNVANAVKFRCYFRGSDGEDEVRNNFVVGDQAYCHVTSVDTKDDDPNSKSLNMKHYWRLIVGRNATNVLTENGEHWIDLSNRASETLTIDGETYTHAGYQSGSDVPAAQDDIIQLGNIYDTDRMGAIVEFVTGADAPSYQIFQGINDFNLNGKNYIGLGYSTQTGRAYINIYGDAYIGDKPDSQGNASSYLKYNAASRQLSIKARIDASSTIDGTEIDEYIAQHSSDWTEEEINSLIHDVTDDIQAQIDGAIDTWFYNGTPSDSVLPESEWKAIDIAAGNNNERLKHLGDIYYDNETGYAYRYSNTGTESSPVFAWNPITDSAVVEALERAAKAQDTADGKRTIYGVWNAWIKDGSNILEVGDLFIPQSTTTQGGVTYTANKVYKCTVKGSPTFQEIAYTDDSAFNGYINAILSGSGSSGNAAVVAAAQKAIKDALGGGTVVDGGLLLTSLIAMRKYKGTGDTSDAANYDTWAGISGTYQNQETGAGYKGHGIAAWYGGGMIDHEVSTSATNYAKSLFRFDGSGYLASGNISWDKNGIVTIANVYSNVNGQNVEWSGTTLQYMNNLSNSLPLTYQSGTAYLDPKISFTNLSVMGKTVATQEWVGNNYISISFFSRLFRAYNGDTLVNANDTTTTIDNIKAMFGFWTEQYISALGQGTGGGGGILTEPLQSINNAGLGTPQSANVGLVWNGTAWTYGTTGSGSSDVTWTALAAATNEQINVSHISTALSGYALTSQIPTNNNQLTNGAGYITSSALSGYLPLSGGTLTGLLTVSSTGSNRATIHMVSAADVPNDFYFGSHGARHWSITSRSSSEEHQFFLYNAINNSNALTFYNDSRAVFINSVTASSFIKSGGTASQFLKADGSVDSNTYALSSSLSNYLPLTGGTLTGQLSIKPYGGNYTDGIRLHARSRDNTWCAVVFCGAENTGDSGTSANTWFAGARYGDFYLSRASTGLDENDTVSFNYHSDAWYFQEGDVHITRSDDRAQLYITSISNKPTDLYMGSNGEANRWSISCKDSSLGYRLVLFSKGAASYPIEVLYSGKTYFNYAATIKQFLNVGYDYGWDNTLRPSITLINPNNEPVDFIMGTNSTYHWSISARGSANDYGLGIYRQGSGYKFWITGNNGDVGIGNTSPSYKLHVTGTFYASGNSIIGGSLDVNGSWIQVESESEPRLEFHIPNVNWGNLRLKSNGQFYFYQTFEASSPATVNVGNLYSYGYVTALSDARHKTIINDAAISVEQIAKMPAVVYRWNDGREDDGLHVGSIAQDWQTVLPEVVLRANDKEGTLSMQYGVASLVSVITVAKRVVNHEKRIKELEEKCERLRTELSQYKAS